MAERPRGRRALLLPPPPPADGAPESHLRCCVAVACGNMFALAVVDSVYDVQPITKPAHPADFATVVSAMASFVLADRRTGTFRTLLRNVKLLQRHS